MFWEHKGIDTFFSCILGTFALGKILHCAVFFSSLLFTQSYCLPSWWDAHHFESSVLYVHLLLLMFVLAWVFFIMYFIYLVQGCYYNLSDILAYEPLYLKVNKFSVCSLTTTPSIFRYTSFLYKEFLGAKGGTVILLSMLCITCLCLHTLAIAKTKCSSWPLY